MWLSEYWLVGIEKQTSSGTKGHGINSYLIIYKYGANSTWYEDYCLF